MPSRPRHLCGAIPTHMLNRMAGRTDVGGAARETLEQMRELSVDRSRTFLEAPSAPPMATDEPRRFRNVYDARRRRRLPGRLVMTEHNPGSADVDATEAYRGSGATFDFFARVFGRNSIDGYGMTLDSTVHYGTRFENALWNGRQMVYGDGDGRIFHRFTASLDIIAHELTHGITQFSAALGYAGQTGALNEHLSDAFGIMVRQYHRNQTAHESDWLIGTELFGPDVNARGVRSMANPGSAYDDEILGRDPQPSHMRDYVETIDDNGGVHLNSGILNHAFYIAAIVIGGWTWEKLGRIWYAVLIQRLRPEADFLDFARATVDVAGELYGDGGRIQRIVAGAWSEVGLDAVPQSHSFRIRRKEIPSMSRKPQSQSVEMTLPSYRRIARGIRSLEKLEVPKPLLSPSFDESVQLLVQVYRAVEPLLTAFAYVPFLPPAWSRAVGLLNAAIQGVVTRVTSGDGDVAARFKAGRDL